MQRFDFVYITSYNECDEPLITGLRDAFARLGKTFAVIGYVSSYVEQLHSNAGIQFFNLRTKGPLKRLDAAQITALEKRLPTSMNDFVFPEQRYYMTGKQKLYDRAAAILDGFDRLFGDIQVGCMIHKLGAELIRRCAFRAAEIHSIPCVLLGTFPAHFKGRMFLHGQIWSERDSLSIPPVNTADSVSFEEFQELLTRIRDRKEVIHYPLIGTRQWSEAFQFIRSMIVNHEYEFIDDLIRRRVELVRFHVRNFLSNRTAVSKIPDAPFYFFPLHVFDDSQITVRNPQFYDQMWIIEYISRVLPHGMKLAVKLHPGLDGAVPLAFLKAISKLENVVLLKGTVNAHEVIKRSAGVIVINSTVAFEALLHRKPVLVLGHWSFGRLGMTEHLEDMRDLPQTLMKLRYSTVNADIVDHTLYNLYGEMHRCSYNRHPINYDDIAGSILKYLGESL